MSRPRTNVSTLSGLALLATAVGVGVMAVGNLVAEHPDPGALVVRQQERLADMGRQLDALVTARDAAIAASARHRLGRTVAAFDEAQAALAWGGAATDEDGRPFRLAPLADGDALRAVRRVSALWLRTGPPLAELAAGAYSVHGDAGRHAVARLQEDGPTLAGQLTVAAADLTNWRPPTSWRAVAAGLIAAGLVLLVAGVRRGAGPGIAVFPSAPAFVAAASPGADAAITAEPVPTLGESRRAGSGSVPPIDLQDTSGGAWLAGAGWGQRAALRDHPADAGGAADDQDGGPLLLRSASRAAHSTSRVATELAECVRDAVRLMDRIAQLSRWTQEAADQIGAQTRQTSPADAALAANAADQVTSLAARTSATAAEIEHTVSTLLCRTREYEESIGRILGHVSAIQRSTRRLGQVVEAPPQGPHGTPPAEAATPVPLPAADDGPGTKPDFPEFPVPPGDEEPEATVDQVAAETAAAIAEFVDFVQDTDAQNADAGDGADRGDEGAGAPEDDDLRS